MENLFFNSNIYRLCGKSIYKFDIEHQTKAMKIDKDERKKIFKFIEEQKNISSNSPKLNQILKENPQLKNIEGIECILGIVEACIPKCFRKTFYKNLKTVRIYFYECFEAGQMDREGEYIYTNNNIIIYTPEHIKNPNFPERNDLYRYVIFTTLIHELFHLASSSYDIENNIIKSGFKYSISNKNEYIQYYNRDISVLSSNNFLNEGFTEFMAKIAENLLYGTSLMDSYVEETNIIMQLSGIIDLSVLKKSYFCHIGTSLIQQKLSKIINDPGKAEYLMLLINNIKKEKEINYTYLIKAESMIIDYYNEVIGKLINSGLHEQANQKFNELVTLYKMIFNSKNFQKALVTCKNYVVMEKDLNEKINSIQKQYNLNLSRIKK